MIEEAVRAAANVPDGPLSASALAAVSTLFVRGAGSLAGVECLSGLTTLRSVEGALSDLSPVRHLTQLETLYVSHNQIADISPLENLPALRAVDLSRNPLSDPTPLSTLAALVELRVDDCGLEALPELSGPLSVLFASDNQIAALTPLSSVVTLKELRASSNSIASLAPLTDLTNLEIVVVGENSIADLSPLAGKPRLERVGVSQNQVSDISPLSGLPALQVIVADHNQISTLAGTTLPTPRCGSQLDFTFNPITASALEHVCSLGWWVSWGTDPVQTCNAPCLQ